MPDPDTQQPPPSPRRKPLRLNSMGAVRRELARLYSDAREGTVQPGNAAKLAYILTCLQKSLESEVIEERLAALEERMNKSGAPK